MSDAEGLPSDKIRAIFKIILENDKEKSTGLAAIETLYEVLKTSKG